MMLMICHLQGSLPCYAGVQEAKAELGRQCFGSIRAKSEWIPTSVHKTRNGLPYDCRPGKNTVE